MTSTEFKLANGDCVLYRPSYDSDRKTRMP